MASPKKIYHFQRPPEVQLFGANTLDCRRLNAGSGSGYYRNELLVFTRVVIKYDTAIDIEKHESCSTGMAELRITKLFERKSCRSCGNKIVVTKVCLRCNEPTMIWCEFCFKIEDFTHFGHSELELF